MSCNVPKMTTIPPMPKPSTWQALERVPPAQPRPKIIANCEAAKRLNDLIFDINPAEICAQIEADNLKKWCEIIQTEMKMAMVQLPCWCKDGGGA